MMKFRTKTQLPYSLYCRLQKLLLLSLFGLFLVACGKGGDPAPEINRFAADNPVHFIINNQGEGVTLSWDVANVSIGNAANKVSLSIGDTLLDDTLPAEGSIEVAPTETTTYSLSASNAEGSVSSDITVVAANVDLTPVQILEGQTAQLSWSIPGVDSIEINEGIGSQSGEGSIDLSPIEPTEYELSIPALNNASVVLSLDVQPVVSAAIIANPVTGISPLTVRFSSNVENNNIVITDYAWDFDGDGEPDQSDTFGAPQTYVYTGNPGDTFEATLTITPTIGDPLVATQTITIANQPPVAQVQANITNGHAPLLVDFSVTAQDPQGIDEISIDYEGDGTFDETQAADAAPSGTWAFQTTYQDEGSYIAVVRVTDTAGAETTVTNNAITVDVNDPLDPIIQISATPVSGNAPLEGSLSASAEVFDDSTITQWRWDLDGDGEFETEGGTDVTDAVTFNYSAVNNFYPVVELTTDSGRTARASLRIEVQSSALPSLSIPDTSDTINSDNGESAAFTVTLPFETELEIWLENSAGGRVKTIQAPAQTAAGDYEFSWDATDDQNAVVSEGDYYVVIGYTAFEQQQEVDLRTTTGGQLSYYRRTTANPRSFDRVQEPLRINYEVDQPAEISFFWQISFGARLMTLLEREPSGRGQYSLYWNGAFPNGQKIPDNLQTLMPGIVRYALSDNVIFVRETPRIENFTLSSTVIWDPRREPIGLNLNLSKPSTIELVVADMDKGVDVATRVFSDIEAGEQLLNWDGKNNDDQYLAPGDYRIGVRSVDSRGTRSLYWFRTQHIDY